MTRKGREELRGTRSLYLCYFGLREPLVQTQVLPYLRELASGGVEVFLLTFEREPRKNWNALSISDWRQRLKEDGIEWRTATYHKSPTSLATLFDIAQGAVRATWLLWRHGIQVLHARSHVPAAMGAVAKKLTGARMIFDIRGLVADEYVDAGRWPAQGFLYRVTKRVERLLLKAADGYVVLTRRAEEEVLSAHRAKPVEVIPCCVDLRRFAGISEPGREMMRRELKVTDRIVLVYAGSLGGAYLTRELVELFAVAKVIDSRAFLLVLSHSQPEALQEELARMGVGHEECLIKFAAPPSLPEYLAAADIGLSLLKTTYSKLAMSPTKIPEYLAAGLPVICSRGIGDVDALVETENVGALLDGLNATAYAEAFGRVQTLRASDHLRARCREVAVRLYDLRAVGGERYRRLYASLHSDLPSRTRNLQVLALATYPVEAAASRYRVVQFIQPLREQGISVTFSPFLDSRIFERLYSPRRMFLQIPRLSLRLVWRLLDLVRARRSDVVWIQREAALFGPPIIEWLVYRVLRRPIVLDLDDPTYLGYMSPVYGRLASLLKQPRKTDSLIRWSSSVIAGNEVVARYARAAGAQTVVLPTVVDLERFTPAASAREIPVLGWIGTHGTVALLEQIYPVLSRLASDHPFRVRIVGSGQSRIDVPGVSIEVKSWRLAEEVEDLRSFDIGLYPLRDDRWNEGKSGFKAVEYMAVGIPFVMSPIGVGATIGLPGQTHLLAHTEDEWLESLQTLLLDAGLRRMMGRAGRAFAEAHFSTVRTADQIAGVLRAAARGGSKR